MSTVTSARTSRAGADAPTHRHDLDGLRGVAIVLVVVYHIWFGTVSGGVDVFLVLSGFFFGGSLLRSALRPGNSLSPVPELVRLARRLLPALVVVLAGSAALTVLVQPQTRWETFADQALASLGYHQNWELLSDSDDYLRAGEAVSPLQHLWSMSVQGQFYVALLAVVLGLAALGRPWLGARLRPVFIVVLAALTAASFWWAVLAHQENQTHAYYDSFARAWELLAGTLVGAAVPSVRWPRPLRALAALLGLAGVLSCGVLIDGVREFPGPWALFPVGATLLLVLAGANVARPPAISRLLATRLPVWLGTIAYSLYLWHWPLLIFWLAQTGHRRVGLLDGLGVLACSLLLAHVTTRVVETPLRRPSATRAARTDTAVPRRGTVLALGAGVAVLAVAVTASSLLWLSHVAAQRADGDELSRLARADYPGAWALTRGTRVPDLPMRPNVLEADDDLPPSTQAGCISDFNDGALHRCVYGDPAGTRSIAVAGGSHAEHWLAALDDIGRRHGIKIVTYLKMGCPLSTDPAPVIVGENIPYPQCHEWVERTMAALAADRPDFVFTNATRPRFGSTGDITPASYLGIWRFLQDRGIGILGIRDTPWNVRDGKPYAPADCLAEGGDADSCGMPRDEVLSDRNPALAWVDRFPALHPLDLSDAVCRPDRCRAVEGNVLLYHDSHHLSTTYVRTLTEELERQLGPATGWW